MYSQSLSSLSTGRHFLIFSFLFRCPYQDDRYLTTLVPVTGSSGLQFPTHYKRFVVKMFTFVDPASLAPLQETVFIPTHYLFSKFQFSNPNVFSVLVRFFIHCSTSVCHSLSGSCERVAQGKVSDFHLWHCFFKLNLSPTFSLQEGTFMSRPSLVRTP